MGTTMIREADKADLPILLNFEQGLIAAERPYDPTIRKGEVLYYDLGGMVDDPDCAVAVAEIDGEVVASGYAVAKEARHYLDHRTYAYLGFMYVRPEFRGRGLNRKIMDYLCQWARQRGLIEIRLTVYEDNGPAIAAYEKAGFRRHIVEMRLE